MVPAPVPSWPVLAELVGSTEQFTGEIDGEVIVIRSNRGPLCRGRVRVGGMGYGQGNLRCSDGRFGRFSVDIKGRFGSAYGRLGSEDLHLIIG